MTAIGEIVRECELTGEQATKLLATAMLRDFDMIIVNRLYSEMIEESEFGGFEDELYKIKFNKLITFIGEWLTEYDLPPSVVSDIMKLSNDSMDCMITLYSMSHQQMFMECSTFIVRVQDLALNFALALTIARAKADETANIIETFNDEKRTIRRVSRRLMKTITSFERKEVRDACSLLDKLLVTNGDYFNIC